MSNVRQINSQTHRSSSDTEQDGRAEANSTARDSRIDSLLTVDDVALRLNVSKDWVWDHSSRKAPYLPVIRVGDGALRYRASKIEDFIDEQERLTSLRRRRK
jgi:predicted DNA-binding transcriptional regulator AlpA